MKAKYLLVFSLLTALAAFAVEVDGIAARVGSSVILKSDVIGEMRRAGAGPDRYAIVRGEMIERELMLKAAAYYLFQGYAMVDNAGKMNT